MRRKTELIDIHGRTLYEDDIVAIGKIGELIWDGAGIITERPVVRITIQSDKNLEVYPKSAIGLVRISYGLARLTGDAAPCLWNKANDVGDIEVSSDTYIKRINYADDVQLEFLR